jgi:hypothetical protein
MQVACPSCAHVITVPPEKAAVPGLKAKCRCGHVFAVAAAAPAPATPVVLDAPGPSTGVVRVANANADRVAEIRAANARAAAAFAATGPGAAAAVQPPPLPPRAAAAPARASAPAPARTPSPAAGPRPVPMPAASASPAAEAPAAEGKVARPHSLPVPWRRCQNHPQVRSEHVCPNCAKGFCGSCTQKVQNAAICPSCEGLCLAATAYEEMQDKAKQRDRSMMDEVPVIARYPLRDTMAFVLLALFTWFFGLAASFMAYAALLSKGVLTWYSFNAVSKVSIGNMRDLMPDFRDVSDIAHAVRLSLAALAISAGPFFLCVFLIPGASMLLSTRSAAQGPRLEVVHAQPPASPAEEEDEKDDDKAADKGEAHSPFEARREGASMMAPVAMLAIVMAALWMIAYMPVALIVAALSKSILSTLNPIIGIDTIKKMGSVYWQALGVYLVLVVTQFVLGLVLNLIPFAGGLVMGFVNAYAALAIGCTLGLAVFKKGAELGWD